jgi:hypothetical protein
MRYGWREPLGLLLAQTPSAPPAILRALAADAHNKTPPPLLAGARRACELVGGI